MVLDGVHKTRRSIKSQTLYLGIHTTECNRNTRARLNKKNTFSTAKVWGKRRYEKKNEKIAIERKKAYKPESRYNIE